MEPRPEFHPVYVSGQYLTSEHLNETHNFLWQEEKATRYLLAGNGIAHGFRADFTGATVLQNLSLTLGAASTIDGYIIASNKNLLFNRGVSITISWFKTTDEVQQLMEKTEFDKIRETLTLAGDPVELDAIELLADSIATEDLPDGAKGLEDFAITAAQALDRIVLAWVFIKDAENNHCQQGDCNTKGIQRNYQTRYFLVKSEQVPEQNSISVAEMPLCAVTRIRNLSDAGSAAGLHQKSFTAWNSSHGQLSGYFSNAPTNKHLGRVVDLLTAEDQTALTAAITNYSLINGSATQANCAQYYNAFAADLCKAINELAIYFNDFVKKYPQPDPKRIERTVIIGSLRSTGADKWRYYFIPAVEQVHYEFDKKRLRSLLYRIIAMVNGFIVQAAIAEKSSIVTNKPLAIPTVTGDVLLQNCAIPYYYNVTEKDADNEMLKYWNPHVVNPMNIFCYYDSKITSRTDIAAKLPDTDWTHHNFFRIEGHIGMAKQAAISAINNLIVSQGLPIQLMDCDINYRGPRKWFDFYDEFVGNLDKWVGILRENYTEYDFGPIKNIQTKIKQTSYRNINDVAKIANDFYAYSNVLYNPPKTTNPAGRSATPGAIAIPAGTTTAAAAAAAAAAGAAATSKIPANAYERYKNIVKPDEVNSIYKKFKEAASEQKDLQSQKLVTLRDLTDIEYLGGVPRGGTFVLLHNGTTVIGDGSLSYYYRINQVRLFSV